MPEVPLTEAANATYILVVPEQLEDTGAADWTWMPNLPGQLWSRPFGRLHFVPASERNWMLTIVLETARDNGGNVDLEAGSWRFELQNAPEGGCRGVASSADEGKLSYATGLRGAVLLVSPDDLERARAEFEPKDWDTYTVIHLPGALKTRGNLGPVASPVS